MEATRKPELSQLSHPAVTRYPSPSLGGGSKEIQCRIKTFTKVQRLWGHPPYHSVSDGNHEAPLTFPGRVGSVEAYGEPELPSLSSSNKEHTPTLVNKGATGLSPSSGWAVSSLPLPEQLQKRSANIQDLDNIWTLITLCCPRCAGSNQKSLIIPRTRKVSICMRKDNQDDRIVRMIWQGF